VPGPWPDDILTTLAESLRATGADGLLAVGREVPERTFLSHGQPPGEPTECAETLASWIAGIALTPPPPTGKRGCTSKSVLSLHLTLYRCVPTMDDDGTPPAPDELSLSAEGLQFDGWGMWREVHRGWTSGTLFDDLGCEAIDLSRGMVVLPPLGGLAGWDITVLVTL
jgi:hypothetical protein